MSGFGRNEVVGLVMITIVLEFIRILRRHIFDVLNEAIAQFELQVERLEIQLSRRRMVPQQCSDNDTHQSYFGSMMWQERRNYLLACHNRLRAFQDFHRIRQPAPEPPPAAPARIQSQGPVQSCRDASAQTQSTCSEAERQPSVTSRINSTQCQTPSLVNVSTQTLEEVPVGTVVDSPATVSATDTVKSGVPGANSRQAPAGSPGKEQAPAGQLPTGNPDASEEQVAVTAGTTPDSGYMSHEPERVPVPQPVEGATHLEVLDHSGEGHADDLDPEPGDSDLINMANQLNEIG